MSRSVRLVSALFLGIGATAGAVALAAPGGSSTDDLKGRELADAMGLTLVEPDAYDTCYGSVVEIEGNVAVCLEAQSISDPDAWELAKRLQGETVTDLDRRIHELVMVASNGTPEQRDEAMSELAVLWRKRG